MAELIRGTSVLLTGSDVMYVADVLAAALKARAQRDGGVPPRLQEITKIVQAAALQYRIELLAGSDAGTERFRNEALEATCVTSASRWLSVEETAERLGVSTGFTRRLCREGTLRSVKAAGNAWLVDEVAVLERLGERTNEAA
ncbi:helix-turn-helix domain-containing protein [Streptomyces sp. RPT161]|uniref:helix-turn-helix domain-containing protein n=1 Tax=Streptomyces sp. RPT161 TaxID=3015993 RepID=UPI0022B90816|nr:helix-turn-helix domain-containing protein [Streptomyces sp. RPT161]